MESIGPEQLTRWFDAHAAAMVLYARQWLEAGRAEDVVQDVFVRLMTGRVRPANVRAWLFRCVRNAAMNELRRHRRRRARRERLGAERAGWFVSNPGDLIDAADVQAALADLPNQQREAIVLRIWGGLSLREVAEVTGSAVSTVFSRYRAGLAEIRKRMSKPCKTTND
ncbi:MAG TPA: RNA polymerase sigma factor [Phycisphaerae bacterium]|nr:RNA polymerase sigma factor [Phycisphaerae bacterium]